MSHGHQLQKRLTDLFLRRIMSNLGGECIDFSKDGMMGWYYRYHILFEVLMDIEEL